MGCELVYSNCVPTRQKMFYGENTNIYRYTTYKITQDITISNS